MSTATDQKISEVVSSPRAVAALKKAGITRLSDVDSLEALLEIPYVGESSVEEITTAGAVAVFIEPIDAAQEVEEGDHPILLSSPYGSYSCRLTRGGEVTSGNRRRPVNPKFISFSQGEAKFTKELWAEFIHDGDDHAKRKFIASNEPWRVEAHAWLSAKPGFKDGSFTIKD